jgi:hypothetical protein
MKNQARSLWRWIQGPWQRAVLFVPRIVSTFLSALGHSSSKKSKKKKSSLSSLLSSTRNFCCFHFFFYYVLAIVGLYITTNAITVSEQEEDRMDAAAAAAAAKPTERFVFSVEWIINAFYFATVIYSTIGYGDIHPQRTPSQQLFILALSCYGILVLRFVCLGIISSTWWQSVRRKQQQQQPDLWLYGAVVTVGYMIAVLEGWSLVECLYWILQSGLTIGFGDYSPQRTVTRGLCIGYLPVLVALTNDSCYHLAQAFWRRQQQHHYHDVSRHSLRQELQQQRHFIQNNKNSKDEYLKQMLVRMYGIQAQDVQEILHAYHGVANNYDNDNSTDNEDSDGSNNDNVTELPLHELTPSNKSSNHHLSTTTQRPRHSFPQATMET